MWIVPFLLLAFLLICVFEIVAKRVAVSVVLKKSTALSQLQQCNSEYFLKFNMSLMTEYTCFSSKKSKAAFDRADFYEILIEYLNHNVDFFVKNIATAKSNAQLYQSYISNCNMIYAYRDKSWYKLNYLERIERDIFEKQKLKPVCDIRIKVNVSYTSPQGRNHYSNDRYYNIRDIESAICEIGQRKVFQQSKQYERSKMSDSLRYDVLKRDGFKCRICGVSASDGVKLHVDHIKPISKGGKTELNNLRTLCSACNLGKSDKYDPYGSN